MINLANKKLNLLNMRKILTLFLASFFIASCCEQKPPKKQSWSGTYESDDSGARGSKGKTLRRGFNNYWELNLRENKGVLLYHDSHGTYDVTLAVTLEERSENYALIKMDSVIWTGFFQPRFESWKAGDLLATVSRKDTALSVSSQIFPRLDREKSKSETTLFGKVKTRDFGPFTNTKKHNELIENSGSGKSYRGSRELNSSGDIQLR